MKSLFEIFESVDLLHKDVEGQRLLFEDVRCSLEIISNRGGICLDGFCHIVLDGLDDLLNLVFQVLLKPESVNENTTVFIGMAGNVCDYFVKFLHSVPNSEKICILDEVL